MIWSSACPPNHDFVDMFQDLEIRDASDVRFHRQFKGLGAPELDAVDRLEDWELRVASEF